MIVVNLAAMRHRAHSLCADGVKTLLLTHNLGDTLRAVSCNPSIRHRQSLVKEVRYARQTMAALPTRQASVPASSTQQRARRSRLPHGRKPTADANAWPGYPYPLGKTSRISRCLRACDDLIVEGGGSA